MELLIAGAVLAAVVLVLGGLLVAGLLKLLLFVLMLPFRLIGAVVSAVGAVVGGVASVLGGVLSVVVSLGVAIAFLIAIPLVPILLLVAAAWAVLRLFRSRPSPA